MIINDLMVLLVHIALAFIASLIILIVILFHTSIDKKKYLCVNEIEATEN